MDHSSYYLLRALTNWSPPRIAVAPPVPLPGTIGTLADITNHLDGVSLVSLDVFDTLLHRDVDPPEYPKRESMQILAWALARQGRGVPIEQVLTLREEAEAEARQSAMARGEDGECTLREILTILHARLERDMGAQLSALPTLDQIIESEIAAEIAHLSPMPGAVEMLAGIRERGIRIAYLSDTYLEETHVRRILEHNGLLEAAERIFISSTARRSKATGRLFDRLIADSALSPQAILHVGDHPVSDHERPLSRGLRALRLYIPAEMERRARARTLSLLADQFGDTQSLWRELNLERRRDEATPLFSVGYRRLGPIFSLFSFEILRQALSAPYAEIFFLARDSHMFHRLYCRLRQGLRISRPLATPEGCYIHLSRPSTELAALQDLDRGLVRLMQQRSGARSGLASLPAMLGLDPAPYAPWLNAHSADDDVCRLLADSTFRTRIETDRQNCRTLLHRYLDKQGLLTSEPILLVDIGWNGSILKNLETILDGTADLSHWHALFFGRLYGTDLGRIQLQPGFAYDQKRHHPIEHLINQCRELFELAAAQCEGSALGYAEMPDGSVGVKRAECRLDGEDVAKVAELQAGITAWCDDFITLYNRLHPNVAAMRADAVIQVAALLTGQIPGELDIIAPLKPDLGWGAAGRTTMADYLGLSFNADSQTPPAVQVEDLQLTLSGGTDHSRTDFQKLFERLRGLSEQLRHERNVVVYGTGTVASLLAPLFSDRIRFFVDGNSALHDQHFLGKPVLSPDAVLGLDQHTVLVTPIGRKTIIQRKLEGFSGSVIFIDDIL